MPTLNSIPEKSILGINYNGAHDSAIAIVSPEGVPVFASSLERVTREKQDGRPPTDLLDGLPWDKINKIAISTDKEPWEPEHHHSKLHPVPLGLKRDGLLSHGPQFLEFVDSLPGEKIFVCHQLSHASSAFWPSGFEESLILTYDGGMHNSPWFGGMYKASRDKGIESLDKFFIGSYAKITSLYSIVTALLGFTPNKHEGKITGLAAFGEPTDRCRKILNTLLSTEDYYRMEEVVEWYSMYSKVDPPVLTTDSERCKKLFKRFEGISREEIAATLQAIAEEHIEKILLNADNQGWKSGSICLAGGLFANVKINQRVKELGFNNIFIAPPMTDDGTALGAALHVASSNETFNPPNLKNIFLGHSFDENEIKKALNEHSLVYEKHDNAAQFVAKQLSAGKSVGIFQGAMEFGPRALCNRSILCNAKDKSVNETLNAKLGRTEFMPFAPVTRVEDADDCYLNMQGAKNAAEFMTITFNCTDKMASNSPAVVHIDGTARPQLIYREKHPFIHDVLTHYKNATGIPSLVNTSFNVHEEPIVRTPQDAIRGFLKTGLDYLYLEGGYIVNFLKNKDRALLLLTEELKRPFKRDKNPALVMELFIRKNEMQKLLEEKEAVIQQQAHDLSILERELQTIRAIFSKFGLQFLWKVLQKIREALSSLKMTVVYMLKEVLDYLERKGHSSDKAITTYTSVPGPKKLNTGRPNLKLSIVTPSYNHGKYIGTTIKSVLANQYHNVEHIVVDGASTDNTVDVVNRYKDKLAKFICEEDNGQTDAINKGFRHATGDIYAYINSDDYYLPGAFEKVLQVFADHPDVDIVYGHCIFVYEDGRFMRYFTEIEPFDEYRLTTCTDFIMQPATFFRKDAYEKIGGFDDSLSYGFDWDAWCKMAKAGMKFMLIEEPLAVNRVHAETKTNSGEWDRLKEIYHIVMRHKQGFIPHAIFNYTLTEVHQMRKKWYRPIAKYLLKLACYKQSFYNIQHTSKKVLYGVYPGSSFVASHVTYYLPWYGGAAKKLSFTVCIPWIEIGKQTMQIKLNGKIVGEKCFCAIGRKIEVVLDCREKDLNAYVLELNFSTVYRKRYGAIVSDVRII